MTSNQIDRYVSFKNINCDGTARRLVDRIQYHLDRSCPPSPWFEYFKIKLAERQSMGQDELFFVGSQVNNIRALFEQFDDVEALNWLDEVEENCC